MIYFFARKRSDPSIITNKKLVNHSRPINTLLTESDREICIVGYRLCGLDQSIHSVLYFRIKAYLTAVVEKRWNCLYSIVNRA